MRLKREEQIGSSLIKLVNDMTIRMLVTGGTFDKVYHEITGELCLKDTHLPEMLKLGKSRLKTKISMILMIDSLNITESDMKVIQTCCEQSKENRIVIIHGTDKMVDTAKFLGKHIEHKTVVLTGAIIPYAFKSSDSLFNLGSSLAFVQTLSPGIYVSMNGKYFNWDNVRKNRQTGEFEESKSISEVVGNGE